MRFKAQIMVALAATALSASLAPQALAAEITMFRFFGDCANEYAGVTDLAKATGECGIVQVLTNRFNAENTIGATVTTQTVDWNAYYDLLSATYSTGNIPGISIMHRSTLPNFVARQLVEPLGDGLTAAGVDFNDFLPVAREAVTIEGQV